MFLSGGGVYAHADPRRTSIAAAIDFAAAGGLQGVILNTLALRGEEAAVAAARARGLRVRRWETRAWGAAWPGRGPLACAGRRQRLSLLSPHMPLPVTPHATPPTLSTQPPPPPQVMTYGLPNDDPEWVRRQHGLGVQGMIVDDVAGVAAALSRAL